MIIKYNYSYGSLIKKASSYFITLIGNLELFAISAIILFLLTGLFQMIFSPESAVTTYIIRVFFIVAIGLLVYLVVISFLNKQIILYDNLLVVKRHMINFRYFYRGFKDEILIREIAECKLYEGRHIIDGPHSVVFFNWDDLVEIKTKDNKKYYIPVKNSQDFIHEIRTRMAKLNMSKNSIE